MPQYNSLYDTDPLPDPGSSSSDPPDPTPVDVAKQLSVQWSGPQPLHTVTPPPPSGSSGSGSGGGGSGSGSGDGSQPTDPLTSIAQIVEQALGPTHQKVHVRPDDLLALEQRLLDLVRTLANDYNTLATGSEQAISEDWWGQEEGSNVIQHATPGETPQQHEQEAGIENTPHYVFTDSALSTQKFLAQLQMNQRSALQHAADIVTLTGGFIAVLNATADAYGEADQYSVFPDKSQISTGSGS